VSLNWTWGQQGKMGGLCRGYHTAVFTLARISSPSVDNCPRHSRGHLSTILVSYRRSGLIYAGASCNNQSETSVAAHDIWKFETKLWSIEALALILAPGISIYNGLQSHSTKQFTQQYMQSCNNSPLLCYNSPSTNSVSGLIYVDRMISFSQEHQ